MAKTGRVVVLAVVAAGLTGVLAWQYWPAGRGEAGALEGNDPAKVTRAMEKLAERPTPEVIQKLAEKRRHANEAIAGAACQALAQVGTTEAAAELSQALTDERPAVQQAALLALARTRAEVDPAPIMAVAETPQATAAVRAEAFETLRARKVVEAIPLMIRGLRDPDPDVRGRAYAGIRRIVEKDYGFKANGDARERAAKIQIIVADLRRSPRVQELMRAAESR